MTTLYYSPGACSLAPHIVLEWIGKPYEAIRVKLGTDEIRAINPAGAVPVLREDDGWTLTQAGAILEYLAAKHPEARLAPSGDLRAQADMLHWSCFFTSDVHASFWPVFSPQRYTTDSSDAALQAVVSAAEAQVAKKFAILEEHLQGREWILDSGKSIIDAYAFPMIRWAAAKLPDGLKPFPNVKALADRLNADAGVQRVLADESGKA